MRNSVPKLLFLAILIGFATGAFATQSLTLTSAGPANLAGVYTSPHRATIEGMGSGIKVFCDDFTDAYLGNTLGTVIYPVPVPMAEPSSPLLFGIDLLTIGGLVFVIRRRQSTIRCIS